MINFSMLFKMAIRSIKGNIIRSLLTALGIIIGVSSVILLVSLGTGLKKYITQEIESVGSNLVVIMPGSIDLDKGGMGMGSVGSTYTAMSNSKLKLDYLYLLTQNLSTVENGTAFLLNSTTVKSKQETKTIEISGTTEQYPYIRDIDFISGQFFSKSDVNSSRKVAVLGYQACLDLFDTTDNVLGKKIQIGDLRFTVIGVLAKAGGEGAMSPDNKIYVPISVSQRQFDKDSVSGILLKTKNPDDVDFTIKMAKKLLLTKLDEQEFTIIDQREILSMVSNILNALTIFLGGIATISLIVGGIGIMNIMLVSVSERTKEIGLRKAIGATPTNIMLQFLIESTIISITGGIIGILLGVLGSQILKNKITTEITLWSIFLSFTISVFVGIIFGVIPARKASKLSPIEALRYE